jgi:hypothetical protein
MMSNAGKFNLIESVSNGASIMFLLGAAFIYAESKFDKLDEKIITLIEKSEEDVITRKGTEHRKWSWFGLAY